PAREGWRPAPRQRRIEGRGVVRDRGRVQAGDRGGREGGRDGETDRGESGNGDGSTGLSPDRSHKMASAAEQLAANLNLGAFAKAEALKKRIWFTLGALLVYRLGTYLPLPGINAEALQHAFNSNQNGLLGMFNMFAGGAVSRMAIFALGI